MNKNYFVRSIALTAAMTMLLAGCGGNTGNPSAEGTESGAKTSGETVQGDVSGSISVGYTSDYKTQYELLFKAFNEKYPNVEITPVEISGSGLGQITKMNAFAASGNLPDVCTGSEELGYIVQQGWAYPLDNLVANDPDKDYILEAGIKNFTYDGHLYALPQKLQFSSIYINEDLLNTLNMDKPGYDWTVEEFLDMAKKATTDEYSGINYVYNDSNPTWGLDTKLMGALLPKGYEQYGYSFETHNVDLTANNAWVESNKIIQDMLSVKGLVADSLWDSSSNGMSDYEKKFGKDSDALVSGKVLFGNHSTWEHATFAQSGFNFDCYPVPTAEGLEQNIQTHIDFAYMTTNCTEDNYQAAYEFLKFMTYSEEGCKIFMDESFKDLESNPAAFQPYIPASANPVVLDYFEQSKIADGIKYMYRSIVENPDLVQVADCDKLIPNYWSDIKQYRDSVTESIRNGADPSALVNDLQSKINTALTGTWEYFEESLQKNLEDFYASHPWEKQ